MAVCPACGKHLHITDWRPECPACKVNLNYYKANETMLDEAEKAEIEHARFQPKIDRAKAAFFGSPLAIIRIVLTFLPIGALFLPLCKFVGKESLSVNAMTLYNYISKADIGKLFSSCFAGDMFSVSLVSLLLSVVMIIVSLILIFAANGKHFKPRLIITYSLFFAFGLVSLITFTVFSGNVSSVFAEYETASLGAGAFVYIALLLLQLILNIYLTIKPIKVKYTPCLIGGLPSEDYFYFVGSGMSKEDIRRKMLIALTKLQLEAQKEREKEEVKS